MSARARGVSPATRTMRTMRTMRTTRMTRATLRGFTLVELVIGLALLSIVAGFGVLILLGPLNSQQAQTRRAELADTADFARQTMAGELARALPGSPRVRTNAGVVAIEFLQVAGELRIGSSVPPGDPATSLALLAPDASFNVTMVSPDVTLPFASNTARLVIGHTGVAGQSAYAGLDVITPPGANVSIDLAPQPGEWRVTLAPATRFVRLPNDGRAWLVAGPRSILCSPALGTITLYTGYTPAAAHTARDTPAELLAAGAVSSTLATGITACSGRVTAGPLGKASVVNLAVTFTRNNEPMNVTLAAPVAGAI